MNIFKKLINWLIKKLGGYTAVEHDSWRKSALTWQQKFIVWHGNYEAEHENYLAMLNLYNTTVEQTQNNSMGVAGAIDTTKAYCKSKGSCDECALYSKTGGCKIHEIPCYWGMSE